MNKEERIKELEDELKLLKLEKEVEELKAEIKRLKESNNIEWPCTPWRIWYTTKDYTPEPVYPEYPIITGNTNETYCNL